MAKLIKACSVDELPPGASKALPIEGTEVVLFNVGGSFHASDNACPHRGGPLSDGRLDGAVVTCPWHGWQFDVTSGALLMNSSTRLKTYKVIRRDDDLFIEL